MLTLLLARVRGQSGRAASIERVLERDLAQQSGVAAITLEGEFSVDHAGYEEGLPRPYCAGGGQRHRFGEECL